MDPSIYLILVAFILLGGFSVFAALFNVEWFFQTNGAQTFVKQFGRKGARIFYAFLGLALMAFGVSLLFVY